MNPLLTAKDIDVGYHHKPVLQRLNFCLYPGDFVCLMGSNGRGKTTLLRSLSAQLPLLAGTIEIDRKNILDLTAQELSSKIAVVLTDRLDLPHLTVRQFVSLGRAPYTGFWGNLQSRDWMAVDEALEKLQISDLASLQYNELSDGQRQMVAVARAVAQETPIILLDEPTNFLDMPHKLSLLSLLKNIAEERRTAILFSSHDWDVVAEMCTLVWLTNLDGKLQIGMPEEIILWGDLSRSFDFHQIHFSREEGRFMVPKTSTHSIQLIGEDALAKKWTSHGLLKEGIEIAENAEITVRCLEKRWELSYRGQQTEVQSLYQLIWSIRDLMLE